MPEVAFRGSRTAPAGRSRSRFVGSRRRRAADTAADLDPSVGSAAQFQRDRPNRAHVHRTSSPLLLPRVAPRPDARFRRSRRRAVRSSSGDVATARRPAAHSLSKAPAPRCRRCRGRASRRDADGLKPWTGARRHAASANPRGDDPGWLRAARARSGRSKSSSVLRGVVDVVALFVVSDRVTKLFDAFRGRPGRHRRRRGRSTAETAEVAEKDRQYSRRARRALR